MISTLGYCKESDPLKRFTNIIKGAKSYQFSYKSGDIEGIVSISNNETYMSQKGIIEIYEIDSCRYSYNIKRGRIDIDPIKREENRGIVLFNWLEHIDDYEQVSKYKDNKGNIIYNIMNRDNRNEMIEIIFSSGNQLVYIVYKNSNIKEVRVDIDNFQTDKKSPSDYFTFDPAKRKELEVTDYRVDATDNGAGTMRIQ